MIGIPKASGGFRSGISRGYRQVILFVDFSFPIQEKNLNECCYYYFAHFLD